MKQKTRKRKKRKIKFKSVSLKLSSLQFAALQRYCSKHKLTPNKVIKKSLKVYLERFGPVIDNSRVEVGQNQLTIFDAGADNPKN